MLYLVEGRVPNFEPSAANFTRELGEPPTGTADPGEMVGFYAELLEVERAVLARMEELVVNASPELRDMVRKTNIERLQDLIAEFEARLRRWEEQL